MKKYLLLFTGLGILLTSCNNDDDANLPANVVVQNFMWRAMNLWYFWQGEVPNLADNKFSTNQEYNDFLEASPDPLTFYESIQFSEDRFSFSGEDYTTLVNGLNGISKSNGLEFGLVRFGSGDDIFGYVRYIIPGSNAASKDIDRGDIFTRVNGQQLTGNNYRALLFGDNEDYTLGMATISGNEITDNDDQVSLTKLEGLTENPVLVSTTLDISGKKIGYIMYNGFTRGFDEELNDAFGQFVTDNVTELVLDMRYNPGGSVNSSRLLASMIYGTNTNDLYIKQRWNDKIQNQLSATQLEDRFAATTNDGTPINTLNLSKVYVIATNSSASASELVMNGLAPYVDVVHIGETTRGKNEFSITMVDDPGNDYIYNKSREGSINPENRWAIQPLVGRNENADGFSDYTDGLAPDIVLEEDYGNLGVLGDVNEPLLARAIQEITGVTNKRAFAVPQMTGKVIIGSEMQKPGKDNMFLDKPITLNFR
ncbi:S41 family peptidase [Flagellimonas pacifica]|uniref:C-terminal processing protease CtpA/Prc, contains a PDZ domain n=1 Tax=Flagellimonas pacifica TaxID=1247520 RepID=A0A285MV57_9FLAO|nr:S41 family peptidase [Allomuricauda parva]SNZ00583.1 C-terminal processing protease CtpA/Prc, contains a PDZ domain [Allomuricauda parva]